MMMLMMIDAVLLRVESGVRLQAISPGRGRETLPSRARQATPRSQLPQLRMVPLQRHPRDGGRIQSNQSNTFM